MRTAFIGLGVMGFPMAGHLAAAGHPVTVYNRNADKSAQWTGTHEGAAVATPREAATTADIVFSCVGNDDDLRSVAYGDDGILAGLAGGAYWVDHTTTSATVAREMDAAARALGAHFLDGPVSGGQAGAENGQLTVMMGGARDDFDVVAPVIDCFAKSCRLMGDAGAGQLTKMVNQICIAGVLEGLAEAMHFAESVDLDLEAVVEVISKGAAQSWQMDNRWPTMAKDEFNFGFAVDWMRKDLGIALDAARESGARLPMAALVDQFYADVQEQGGGRFDTSSLVRRYRK